MKRNALRDEPPAKAEEKGVDDRTAAPERLIQPRIGGTSSGSRGGAGARDHRGAPLPFPHRAKAGLKSALDMRPIYDGHKQRLDYAKTGGATDAFTRSLPTHLFERGVRADAVSPTPVCTPLNPADNPAEAPANLTAETPMGEPAKPEEIAAAYVLLAAPCIRAEILPIVGGYSGA